VRSLLAKTSAESLRVGSNLVFYTLLAGILLLVLSGGAAPAAAKAGAPPVLREALFLVVCWQGCATVLVMLLCLAVVGSEQGQFVLLASSPVPRRALLSAKAVHASLPLAVLLVLTAAVGPLVAGTGVVASLAFLLAAPALLLHMTGVMVAVGTWPRFIRVHADVPLANSLRTSIPVLVVAAACYPPFVLVMFARRWLADAYDGRGPFAGSDGVAIAGWGVLLAWAVGAVVFALGWRLAARNVEVLFGPQD
jgi:hypothetical protein